MPFCPRMSMPPCSRIAIFTLFQNRDFHLVLESRFSPCSRIAIFTLFQNRDFHLVPESRFSPCSRIAIFTLFQNRDFHLVPEPEIAISRMSFLLSLHFPEFEIVQNDILGQNIIFPRIAFCLRMSFCARTRNIISLVT